MIRVNRRWRRRLGLAVNAGLRVAIVGFAIEAALAGADPRFDNKGIAVRNLVFAGVAVTLAVPLLHLIRGRRRNRYPLVADTLVLSILALDMAANSLNLYALPWRFDLIPHTYSPLAGVLVLADLGVGRATRTLAVLAAAVLFELQEVAGDLYFGTSNVGGAWDTAGDLAGAVTGAVLIPWAAALAAAWGRVTGPPPHRSYSCAWQIERPRTPRCSSLPRPHRSSPPRTGGR